MRAPRNPNQPQRISNFAAGLLAIAIAFCACWLAFKGAPWSDKWELRAVVRQANELGPRSPVRIAGVEVGKVEKVERGEGDTSIVTLALEDDALPIHEDATIKVRPRIFLEGNFFVDLKPGTPGAPTADEGYTIPVAQTAAPVQLDQILSTLQMDTRDEPQAAPGGARRGSRRRRRSVAERGVEALRRGLHAGRAGR